METRESPENQDSTSVLQRVSIWLPKSLNDPTVDTHILVQGFGRKQGKMTSSKKGLFLSKITAQTPRLIFGKSDYDIPGG